MTGYSRWIVAAAAILVAAAWCGATEPTPTPTPKSGDQSLSDVAGDITLDKDAIGTSGSIVIDNKTLSDLSGKGYVTEVTTPGVGTQKRGLADVQGDGAEIEGEMPGFGESMEKKQYWQAIYSQQLDFVKDIRAQIDALDTKIPGLWRDFYAWDDPAYRDGVIKPQLDEALAQRQKLEVDLTKAEAKLGQIKQDARKDGAQPGWFRGFDPLPTPRPTVGVMPP